MVTVELGGDVTVSGGQVEQVFVTAADNTVTNRTVVQVGQSLVMVVSMKLVGITVAGILEFVVVEIDPGTLTGVQVRQGLKTVSVEPDPEVVTGGQIVQGRSTVVAEIGPGVVTGGQV